MITWPEAVSGWFRVPAQLQEVLRHFKKTSGRISRPRLVYRKCLTRL